MQPTKPRILYLDEDAEDSFTLTMLLKLANYDPVATNFACDALQLAQSEDFDLYILSRRFPVDSGVYLCQRLHDISPQTPIIFLSGEASVSPQQQSISSGSDEYIAKSKDAHEMLAAVRQALHGKLEATAAVNL